MTKNMHGGIFLKCFQLNMYSHGRFGSNPWSRINFTTGCGINVFHISRANYSVTGSAIYIFYILLKITMTIFADSILKSIA